MKAKVFLVFALMIVSATVFAQEHYWVVESNMNVPHQSVVKIYDRNNALVHEVSVAAKLDVTNRRHRKVLMEMMKRYHQREAVVGKGNKSKSSV